MSRWQRATPLGQNISPRWLQLARLASAQVAKLMNRSVGFIFDLLVFLIELGLRYSSGTWPGLHYGAWYDESVSVMPSESRSYDGRPERSGAVHASS